jgi:hypothetical protein
MADTYGFCASSGSIRGAHPDPPGRDVQSSGRTYRAAAPYTASRDRNRRHRRSQRDASRRGPDGSAGYLQAAAGNS